MNTNREFFTDAVARGDDDGGGSGGSIPPSPPSHSPSTIVNETRHEAVRFAARVKFLRLGGATLTDAPAEEIVPRDAHGRARAIVSMKNRRDVP